MAKEPIEKTTTDESEQENLEVDEKELESLLKVIKELEKMKKEDTKKSKNTISIEFGSVFHKNGYINFVFSFILNLTLIYLVIELFNFAIYTNIIYVIILALVYTFFETIYRTYVLFNHFSFVLKSLGFIFYIGYVAIFYSLDVYIFQSSFSFVDETLLIAFVAIFTLVRYIIGTMIFRYFKKRNLR